MLWIDAVVFGGLLRVSAAGVRQACGPSGVPRFRESWGLLEAIAGRGTFLTPMGPDLCLVGALFIDDRFDQ